MVVYYITSCLALTRFWIMHSFSVSNLFAFDTKDRNFCVEGFNRSHLLNKAWQDKS